MRSLLASRGHKCGAGPFSAQSGAPAEPPEEMAVHSWRHRTETELVERFLGCGRGHFKQGRRNWWLGAVMEMAPQPVPCLLLANS